MNVKYFKSRGYSIIYAAKLKRKMQSQARLSYAEVPPAFDKVNGTEFSRQQRQRLRHRGCIIYKINSVEFRYRPCDNEESAASTKSARNHLQGFYRFLLAPTGLYCCAKNARGTKGTRNKRNKRNIFKNPASSHDEAGLNFVLRKPKFFKGA